MNRNKEKQREDIVQDEEVLLYKPYNISLSSLSETLLLDGQMLQDKINNLEKVLKTL